MGHSDRTRVMAISSKELSLNAHITTKLDFSPAHSQLYLCCTVFEADDSNSWTLINVVASKTHHEHLGKTTRQIIYPSMPSASVPFANESVKLTCSNLQLEAQGKKKVLHLRTS